MLKTLSIKPSKTKVGQKEKEYIVMIFLSISPPHVDIIIFYLVVQHGMKIFESTYSNELLKYCS